MAANWSALRGFWFARSPWSHRRLIFLSRIVSASISGLDAHAASPGELHRIDKRICWYLRALSKGKAHDHAATESHGRSWTNAQLFHKWKVLPARAEIAFRRVEWWQAMKEHNHAHLQTMATKWGQLPDGPPTLTSEGVSAQSANPFATLLRIPTQSSHRTWKVQTMIRPTYSQTETSTPSATNVYGDRDVRKECSQKTYVPQANQIR